MRRFLIISILFLLLVLAAVILLPKVLPLMNFLPTPVPQVTLQPTAGVVPTEEPLPTLAPEPTATLQPTPEPTPLPTEEPEPPVVQEVLPFAVQGEVQFASGEAFHPEASCAWMGVHGRVFGANGLPINGIRVRVIGNVNGNTVDLTGLTGEAELMYGLGAYEITLSNAAGPGIFWVSLEDDAGVAVSEPRMFTMMGNCDQSLAIANFYQQSLALEKYFLPMIGR